jgi:hypothetical protein
VHSWASPRDSRTHSRAVSEDPEREPILEDTPRLPAARPASPLPIEDDGAASPPASESDPEPEYDEGRTPGAPPRASALLPLPELSSSPSTTGSSPGRASLATPASSPARPSAWAKLRRKSSSRQLQEPRPAAGLSKLLTRTLSRK